MFVKIGDDGVIGIQRNIKFLLKVVQPVSEFMRVFNMFHRYTHIKAHGHLSDDHFAVFWNLGTWVMTAVTATLSVLLVATEGEEPRIQSFSLPVYVIVLFMGVMAVRMKVGAAVRTSGGGG